MRPLLTRLWVLSILVAVTPVVLAHDVTLSGTVRFTALDGSADDHDGTANGVFTVSDGDLIVNGTVTCSDDPPLNGNAGACAMNFAVSGDVTINAGGALTAENLRGTGTGGNITITAGGNLVLKAPSSGLAGALISSGSPSTGNTAAGAITANVTGSVTLEGGSVISAASKGDQSGAIQIVAGSAISAGGLIASGASRTVLTTKLTAAVLDGGSGDQRGGAITLRSTGFGEPGVTVGSDAVVVSQGDKDSAGPVTLEGCGVTIRGLVAAVAGKTNATARVNILSGKDILVESQDLGGVGPRKGRLRADNLDDDAVNNGVDLFANETIQILGPSAGSLYSISSSPNKKKITGGTVRVTSVEETVTISGRAVTAGLNDDDNAGGKIEVRAKGDVFMNTASLAAVGDYTKIKSSAKGGTIVVRSHSGNIVWTNGVGDVRPIGSAAPASAQGSIMLTACGTITTSGSSFPTTGAPVGPFPATQTGACSPAAPSLPSGVLLPVCNTPPVANDTTATTNEDNSVVITMTGTDVDGDPLTFSIVSGPSNGSLSAITPAGPNAAQVTYSPNANYFGSDSFTFQVNDGNGGTDNGLVSITVNPVNDPPTFSTGPNTSTPEDAGPQTFNPWATSISPGPANESGQTVTFQIVGNTNPSLFSAGPDVSPTGVLTYTSALNANGNANITIRLVDNGGILNGGNDTSANQTFSITITAVNDAPVVNAATFSVDENSANGTVVGTATFTDVDSGQSHTYAITGGNTGGAFAINAGTGQITVANSAALNYEATPSFSLTVTVTDNGSPVLSGSNTITVNLNDKNDAPVINAQTFSVDENSANGTAVGTVVATDEDAGQSLTYAITGGNTGGAFAINPSTGALSVANSAALNFESNPSFALTVTVTDNGVPVLSASNTVTVNVNDVNEAPVVNAATFIVAENSPNGTSVGTVTFTDPDGGQTHTFAITAGNTGGAFAINASSGQITVANSAALNFETTPSFSLTVTVTDNGSPSLSGSNTITINLTDVNEAPVVNAVSFNVDENSANGTAVGTATFSDPDAGQAHSFSITGGNTGGAFAINVITGQITVANSAAVNFEVNSTFNLTVTVTDNGAPALSGSNTVTITVNDKNDAPVIGNQTFSVAENSANGTVVGSVVATDEDAGQTLTYAIVGGNTGGAFAINASTGQITVANSAALNFETNPTFNLTVEVTDNGTPVLSSSATVTINLTNENEAPVVNSATFSVAENSANGTNVGTVTFTDPDAGQTHTYAITGGNTGGAFAINASTGQITVANSSALNFEALSSYSLTVQVTDNGSPNLSGSATVTINVTDVNEAPVVNAATFSTAENSANGTNVGTATFTDQDAGQSHTFSITGGNTGGAFAINASTGQITVANSAALNYETNPTFNLTVTVTDNGSPVLSGSNTVTINLTDVNEAPVVNAATFSVAENSANGTNVGTVTFTDPDSGQTHTFAIIAGNTGGAFAINSSTGQITVANSLNFESQSAYSLTVQVTDNGSPSLSGSNTITINVTNVNEAPAPSGGPFTIAENSANGTLAGTVAANDPDAGQTHTWMITAGNTGGAFTINSSGQILVANSSAVNFEATPAFTLTVQATDSGAPSQSGSTTVVINVTDVNEAPTANTDNYSFVGNTELRIGGHAGNADAVAFTSNATGLLANDTDPDSPPNLSVVPASGTTGNGSRYAIAANGSMVYTPGPGFSGSENISYTITDGPNNATGTITFTFTPADMIWYVTNANTTAPHEGTSTHPFNTMTAAQTASSANHIIYVFLGDGSAYSGIALKDGQKLWGQGVDLTVNGGTILVTGNLANRPLVVDSVDTVRINADIVNGNRVGVQVRGLRIGSTANNAIDVTSADAALVDVLISDNIITGAGLAGIDVNHVSTGTAVLNISRNEVTATGNGIDITRTAGTVTISGLAGNTVSGNTGGSGIVMNGAVTFDAVPGGALNPVSGGSTTIGTTGNGVGASGITMNNATGTLSFTSLNIVADNGTGLAVAGNGATTNISAAAGSIVAANGPAVDAFNTVLGLNLATLTSINSASRGVHLDTVTGSLTATGGSITNASLTDFEITAGSPTVSYGGSITDDIGQLVRVDNNSGGTKTFSGPITDGNDGDGSGILLTSNTGATIRFSGGLVLSTGANPAFTATGGGTVEVCDDNPCNPSATGALVNTLTTTSSAALTVANTNIGANNLEFRSITAGTGVGSAGVGISLDGTGTGASNGGLRVKGTGIAGSGGTIQRKTGADGSTSQGVGIYLNQTKDASFTRMQLNDFDNFAIRANELVGLTLSDVTVSGINGNSTAADEGGIFLEDAGGAVTISNTSVSGGFDDNLRVLYDNAVAGPVTVFNVTGSTFRDLQAGGNNAQVNLRSTTAASASWNVSFNFTSSCTFENDANTIAGANFSDGLLATFEGPFQHSLNVQNATFHHLFQGLDIASNFSADVNYTIKDNVITFTEGVAAIAIGSGSSSTVGSFVTALIQRNNIGMSGVAQSGNRLGLGIVVDMRGNENAQFTLHDNQIRRTEVNGIQVIGQTAADGNLDIQITNNVIAEIEDDAGGGAGIIYGIEVTTNAATSHDICLDIRNNDSFNLNAHDIRVRQSNAAVTFAIEGLTGSGTSNTNVENYLVSQNPGNTANVRTGGSIVNYTSSAGCSTPGTL